MIIEVKIWEDSDCCQHQEMIIDGKESVSVHPLSECPEDAIIERDLVSCTDIVTFMQLAYNAGKNGEEFNYFTSEGEQE
jgi:hypothetical protein